MPYARIDELDGVRTTFEARAESKGAFNSAWEQYDEPEGGAATPPQGSPQGRLERREQSYRKDEGGRWVAKGDERGDRCSPTGARRRGRSARPVRRGRRRRFSRRVSPAAA